MAPQKPQNLPQEGSQGLEQLQPGDQALPGQEEPGEAAKPNIEPTTTPPSDEWGVQGEDRTVKAGEIPPTTTTSKSEATQDQRGTTEAPPITTTTSSTTIPPTTTTSLPGSEVGTTLYTTPLDKIPNTTIPSGASTTIPETTTTPEPIPTTTALPPVEGPPASEQS
jgi:hypothetical protein